MANNHLFVTVLLILFLITHSANSLAPISSLSTQKFDNDSRGVTPNFFWIPRRHPSTLGRGAGGIRIPLPGPPPKDSYISHFFSPDSRIRPPISSLSIQKFDKHSRGVTLDGRVHLVEETSSVRLDFGTLRFNNPIQLATNLEFPRSFTTDFEFSLPPENTDGRLTLHYTKGNHNNQFSIIFDPATNVIRITGARSGVTVKEVPLASVGLVLNSGQKLRAWVDYEASTKTLEVRLSGSGIRPYYPVVSCEIDLSGQDTAWLVIGGYSTQSSATVYSWNFMSKHVPSWFHSLHEVINTHQEVINTHQEVEYLSSLWMILGSFVVGVAVASIMMMLVLFGTGFVAGKRGAKYLPLLQQ